MKQPVPVMFGEVLFDCFEDGSRVLGGAPFNVAWHLQAFGCSPVLISRVGDDPMGRQIRDTMQGWGMTTAGLQKDSAHHTGEVRVTLDGGQPGFEILPDRAYDHIHGDVLPPMQPALVYHGSLGLRMPESAAALDRLVERHPVPIFLDVNLRPPWWEREQMLERLERARWVKINDEELMILLDEAGDLEERARRFKRRYGLDWIIVTRGARGAFLLDGKDALFEAAPGPALEVVDTVGAGDAFASVCILGLLRDWPAESVIARAQQFASLLVGQRGATIADAALYQRLLNDWLYN